MKAWIYRLLQKLLPNCVFYYPKSNKWHLTIDDSPSPHTFELLKILKDHQVKATFFCIGTNIEFYPNEYKAIVNSGHHIGYHSYYHLNNFKISRGDFRKDFELCNTLIQSDVYRPPYGKITPYVYQFFKSRSIKVMFYNILLDDWKPLKNPIKHLKKKLKNAIDGSIIVLHDNNKSIKNSTKMLSYLMEHYRDKF